MTDPSKIIGAAATALHWRRRFILFVLLMALAPPFMRSILGEDLGGVAALVLILYVFRSELTRLIQFFKAVRSNEQSPATAVAEFLQPLAQEMAAKKAAAEKPPEIVREAAYDPLATTASPTDATRQGSFLNRGARQPLPLPQSKDALFWRKPR